MARSESAFTLRTKVLGGRDRARPANRTPPGKPCLTKSARKKTASRAREKRLAPSAAALVAGIADPGRAEADSVGSASDSPPCRRPAGISDPGYSAATRNHGSFSSNFTDMIATVAAHNVASSAVPTIAVGSVRTGRDQNRDRGRRNQLHRAGVDRRETCTSRSSRCRDADSAFPDPASRAGRAAWRRCRGRACSPPCS